MASILERRFGLAAVLATASGAAVILPSMVALALALFALAVTFL